MRRYKHYEMSPQNAGDDLQATFDAFCAFLLRKPRDKGPITFGHYGAPTGGRRFKIRRAITKDDVAAFFAESPTAVRFTLQPWTEPDTEVD